ncbi:hypothetical protein [Garciella nitratireducens]|nr:hypothetical protein [Garciella nitratireducens]RBP41544.1 hypothetical protein DFR81_11014 [Garciella nitratireducens]
MPFYHNPNIILQDQLGSIHYFSYYNQEISYVFFDKFSGETKKGS